TSKIILLKKLRQAYSIDQLVKLTLKRCLVHIRLLGLRVSRQIHTRDRILAGLPANVIEKIDPSQALEADGQMHRALSRYGSCVGLAARKEQDIPGPKFDLLRLTRSDLHVNAR